MGDISTHHEVMLYVVRQLKTQWPDENYTYLVLGNFLTDVSQFRDPTASIGAKISLVKSEAGPLADLVPKLSGIWQLREWFDEMFGMADRRGSLVVYWSHIARLATHIFFNSGSQFNYFKDPENKDLSPISAGEINDSFDKWFTQYYYHEHLDFPPLVDIPTPMAHPRYRREDGALINYLYSFAAYVVDELTKLEYDWRKNGTTQPNDATRLGFLRQLGHILHTVEDFFFHSNLLEVHQFHQVLREFPDKKPWDSDEDYRFILSKSRVGGSDPDAVEFRRRMARRLRFPNYTEYDKYDEATSTDASRYIYTGGFGSTDLLHTLSAGLHSIEEKIAHAFDGLTPNDKAAAESTLGLFPVIHVLLNKDQRKLIATSKSYFKEKRDAHIEQLRTQSYTNPVRLNALKFLVSDEGARATVAAYDLDRAVQDKFRFDLIPEKFKPPSGVGGVVFSLASKIYTTTASSSERSKELNRDTGSVYDQKASNGASAETIGTHTLMSKDGVEKLPFRNEAVGLAKFASANIARLLFQRVMQPSGNAEETLDWWPVVNYFLTLQLNDPDHWVHRVVAAVNNHEEIPALEDMAQKPPLQVVDKATFTQRSQGKLRTFHEQYYKRLESVVERQWNSARPRLNEIKF